jgi:hypothetical protein
MDVEFVLFDDELIDSFEGERIAKANCIIDFILILLMA